MPERIPYEQVVRDIFKKCASSLSLDARCRVIINRGSDAPDVVRWTIFVRQVDGLEVVIGDGVTEFEMWRGAYSRVCTANAERWRELTRK